MSKENLGKVLITPKGEWADSTSYGKLDVVAYNGGSWLAKQANTGVAPSEGDSWTNLLSITKQGIIDGLGYVPDNDEYKLLATFNVTETAAFSLTEIDGKPLSLKKLKVLVNRVTLGDETASFFTTKATILTTNNKQCEIKVGYHQIGKYDNCWLGTVEICGEVVNANTRYTSLSGNGSWTNGHATNPNDELNWAYVLHAQGMTPSRIVGLTYCSERSVTPGTTIYVFGVE